MAGLSMPGGDPGALRQLATQLDTAATGVGNLGANTRQVSDGIRSGASWEGDAADSFTSFTGNLSQGTSAAEGPLTQMASAVREYAGYLETAQQKVASYATAAEVAQVSGNDSGYVTLADQAGQEAEAAVAAQQAAGQRAAGQVSAAAGELKGVFGEGPVQGWINSQPMPWDSLSSTPGPDGSGTETYPIGPEIGTGSQTPIGTDLPTGIVDGIPPEVGTGTETFPIGALGPLINHDTEDDGGTQGEDEGTGSGQDEGEPGQETEPEPPGEITGYTNHGQGQAEGRDGGAGVNEGAINDAVDNPVQVVTQGEGDNVTYKFVGQNATVILNPAGQVVTTWATNRAGRRN